MEFFREQAKNSDWVVRLACAEVLGRFPNPENTSTLLNLAADPTAAVAQRAAAALED